jgi:hypothetical protein
MDIHGVFGVEEEVLPNSKNSMEWSSNPSSFSTDVECSSKIAKKNGD